MVCPVLCLLNLMDHPSSLVAEKKKLTPHIWYDTMSMIDRTRNFYIFDTMEWHKILVKKKISLAFFLWWSIKVQCLCSILFFFCHSCIFGFIFDLLTLSCVMRWNALVFSSILLVSAALTHAESLPRFTTVWTRGRDLNYRQISIFQEQDFCFWFQRIFLLFFKLL